MAALRIGNAPCSWGVMSGFDSALFLPHQQVLDEIAAAGYTGTELGDWGYLPTESELLRAELDRRGLQMIGALVPVPFADFRAHADGRDTALRTARLLASCSGDTPPLVILTDANGANEMRTRHAGRIQPEEGLSPDQWVTFAAGVNAAARAVLDETGLRTAFHHHCAGFVETPAETARLMSLTDASLVGLCFDTGHWAYGGGDVLDGLRRFRSRIWHVHFKDCHEAVAGRARNGNWDYFRALSEQLFFGLGSGDIDFAGVLGELRSWNYQGWIVVEDELPPGAGNPAESARRDREYLRGLGV